MLSYVFYSRTVRLVRMSARIEQQRKHVALVLRLVSKPISYGRSVVIENIDYFGRVQTHKYAAVHKFEQVGNQLSNSRIEHQSVHRYLGFVQYVRVNVGFGINIGKYLFGNASVFDFYCANRYDFVFYNVIAGGVGMQHHVRFTV